MPEPIKLKINLSNMDKSALYKGKKGIYLDAVAWPTRDSKYGDDYYITQDLGKDRRDEKGAILGNGKFLPTRQNQGGQRSPAPAPAAQEEDDQVPF